MTIASGAQWAPGRKPLHFLVAVVVAALLCGLLATGTQQSTVAAAGGAKVAIIVGPNGSKTAENRDRANAAAREALLYTSNVVKVYSPNATWARVKAAISGASIVVYFGRGKGFPSPYSSTVQKSSEDGFGLNPVAGRGNESTKYYGEAYIRLVHLAPGALVLLHPLAYAPGNSEPGRAGPSLSVARRRVDNYGAGFLAAGAAVVVAETNKSVAVYYIRRVFTRDATLDSIWRASPTRHGHVSSFSSTRTTGAKGRTDPVYPRSGFTRSIVGWTSTSTMVVRQESPTPTASPGAASGTTGLYGSGINADNLNNSQIGGPQNQQAAYRFRAKESSGLSSIRIYVIDASHPGYGGGTGGTMRITVQTDDGTVNHLPSGTILATTDVVHPVDGAGNVYAFASPPQLVAGQLYHIVFRNVDPSPTVNFVSVDGLFVYSDLPVWQPAFSNTDWANLVKLGSGSWSADRGTGNGTITPIMGLSYTDGVVDGLGYMEVWYKAPKTISGSGSAREAFTVSGPSRQVSSVSVRLKRVSGSSPLVVRLETSSGALVEQGSIPASSISTTGKASWATYSFTTSPTLTSGLGYHLVLSSVSDTSYSIFVIRKGMSYGFGPRTYFADGSAQYNSGSGWVGFDPGWSGPSTQGDLQFYFR